MALSSGLERVAVRWWPGVLVAVSAAAFVAAPSAAQVDPADLRCDFDGDGYADLAAGVPGESIGASEDAGAVNVFSGGPGGITAT